MFDHISRVGEELWDLKVLPEQMPQQAARQKFLEDRQKAFQYNTCRSYHKCRLSVECGKNSQLPCERDDYDSRRNRAVVFLFTANVYSESIILFHDKFKFIRNTGTILY